MSFECGETCAEMISLKMEYVGEKQQATAHQAQKINQLAAEGITYFGR
jgi:hypothetical protein